ncbi:hypothetical protein [Thermosulfurimonas dismutans]|uniref:Uncharacterized protein n=1 Tax=Thermosulfurimonas dismutans TaxID=999894 RepID=A0A179D2Y5_9BACT|nr:hypothetical protein [Thermosulfurimonas dismutans]OAQ20343.1 hypothetical protein TDIS_1538 [Thermosulfurimonas dismutans]
MRDKVQKARDKYFKAIKEIEKIQVKIAELQRKIQALQEENASLQKEAGEILAKINLGELPETARKEAEAKRKQMDKNGLEIQGCELALKELQRRQAEKEAEAQKARVGIYLVLRDKVMDLAQRELRNYQELARKILRSHTIFIRSLDWLDQMELCMQKIGYKRDGKPEEIFGELLHRPFARPGLQLELLEEVAPGQFEARTAEVNGDEIFGEELGFLTVRVDFSWAEDRLTKALDKALGLEPAE